MPFFISFGKLIKYKVAEMASEYEDCGKKPNTYSLCKACNIVIAKQLEKQQDILVEHLNNPMHKQSVDGKTWYNFSKWGSIDR